MYRWILAIDLDRCLLDRRGELSEANRLALSRAFSSGAAIVLATGRMNVGVKRVLAEVPPVAALVLLNGALVIDQVTHQVIFEQALDPNSAKAIYSWCSKNDCRAVLCGKDSVSFVEIDNVIAEYLARTGAEAGIGRAPWMTDWPCYKALVYGLSDSLKLEAHVASALRSAEECSSYSIGMTGFGYVEVQALGVGKDRGLGILLSEATLRTLPLVTVGDGERDVGMLRMTRHSYAVANASPDAMDAAEHVVDDCDHNGAAMAIMHFLDGSRS